MYNKKIKWSVLLIILCLVSVNAAFGWWSEIGSADTHEKLSKEILSFIDPEQYPDIHKFSEPIWAATEGNSDDADAHNGDGGANDGPVEDWWNIAIERYKAKIFGSLVLCGVVIYQILLWYPNKEYPSVSINIR